MERIIEETKEGFTISMKKPVGIVVSGSTLEEAERKFIRAYRAGMMVKAIYNLDKVLSVQKYPIRN